MNMRIVHTKYHSKVLGSAISLYIYLLLFDGILRKWVFPSASYLIMTLKLMVLIYIVIRGFPFVKRFSVWEKSFVFIGFIVFCTSLLFGHSNLLVTIWGCLPYWFAFTGCYTIGKLLSEEDIINIGKLIVFTAIANAILTAIQFVLPVNHILNFKGGYKENLEGMSAGELAGMFRPSGFFLATNGTGQLTVMALAFFFYFFYIRKGIMSKKILLVLLLSIGLTGICAVSRTTIFYIIGMSIFFLVFCAKPVIIAKFFKSLFVIIPLGVVLSFHPVVNRALSNMGNRFDNAASASSSHGTIDGTIQDIFNRTIWYNIKAITNPTTLDGTGVPFWGYGQGMSTQVGSKLLGLNKHSGFALAEWDGLRIVCESGLLLGWIILYIRLAYVLRYSFKLPYMKRKGLFLPILLWPLFFLSFFYSNTWGNIFNMCFAVFAGGLFLAAYKKPIVDKR